MHIRWRGLELPGAVTADPKTLSSTYGKFIAEPFERGFGTTVGNSLRRVLLSSLEGSAVTQIKVGGVAPRVHHDQGRARGRHRHRPRGEEPRGQEPQRLDPRASASRRAPRGPVTGADIQTDDAVEVVNKDLVLATLTDDVPFELEMVVENGRGLRAGERAQPRGPGNRHHSRRRRVQPGDPRAVRGRGDPRRPEDQLRQADHGDLDQRHRHARDGARRGRQDSPQAPQSVRRLHQAGAGGRTCPGVANLFAVEAPLESRLGHARVRPPAVAACQQLPRTRRAIESLRDLVSRRARRSSRCVTSASTTLQEIEEKLRELALQLGMPTSLRGGRRLIHRRGSSPRAADRHPISVIATRRNLTMRHRRKGRVLGRSPSHQRALLRNLASALMLTEREGRRRRGRCARQGRRPHRHHLAKAKEVRPLVERCITIAKRGLVGGRTGRASSPPRPTAIRPPGSSGGRATSGGSGPRPWRPP